MAKISMEAITDLSVLISNIQKELGDRVIVQRGSDIVWQSAERLQTGSLGLDIALNGGIPRGMMTQFMGEESSGKTTMALKIAGMVQQKFGAETAIAWVAIENFDKSWANQCGCSVPFSEEELDLMSDEDADFSKEIEEIGTFVVGQATTGEDALELALRFIQSNKFQLVVVDSVAALVPAAEEEKEMAENTMGQIPRLLGKFLRKCYSAFNTKDDSGAVNQTAVVLVNQVREQIGTYGHPEPREPGGWALRHASSAKVRFKRGELLKDDKAGVKRVYGKRTKVRVEKSKIGPPFREAEFDFYFQPEGEFMPGDIDTAQEVRIWGVHSGIIKQTSNVMYELDNEKFRGKDALEDFLRKRPERMAELVELIRKVETTG